MCLFLFSHSVLLALIAGDTVLLKPSPQTPNALDLPRICCRSSVSDVIKHPSVNFASFTGSVAVGRVIAETAAKADGFTALEVNRVHSQTVHELLNASPLGGKDLAYVAPDADLAYTAAELVDGAFFNSAHPNSRLKRIYVHEAVYVQFVAKFVDIIKNYRLGDPTSRDEPRPRLIILKPHLELKHSLVKQGARALIPDDLFTAAKVGTAFVAPQVLVDVNHTMDVMTEETFGPVVGIQRVSSTSEAIVLMNDSKYGLTASVWTNVEANAASSEERFLKFVNELDTGTMFLNRCNYLDPALSWVEVKDSGRSVSLRKFEYDQLTRPKSVHMKIKTSP